MPAKHFALQILAKGVYCNSVSLSKLPKYYVARREDHGIKRLVRTSKGSCYYWHTNIYGHSSTSPTKTNEKRAREAQERRENLAKESAAAAALPKTPDDRYKTGAAKMLEVFAYIVWICGGIDVIAIAVSASRLRYSYYSTGTTGTTLFFLAVAVATSALFFGGLLYGASKLLIDIHATRVNLEQLNEKKEAQQ